MFKKLLSYPALALALVCVTYLLTQAGINDRFSNIDLEEGNWIEGPEISAPGAPVDGRWRIYSTTDVPYFISDGQSAISMIASAPAWDGITDSATTGMNITMGVGITTISGTTTTVKNSSEEGMFNIESLAAIEDMAVFSIRHATGNAVNGSLAELNMTDTDLRFLNAVISGVTVAWIDSAGGVSVQSTVNAVGVITADSGVSSTLGISVGDGLSVTDSALISGLVTASSGVSSTLGVTVGDGLTVTENVNVTGTGTIGGLVTASSGVSITGGVNVSTDATVAGNVKVTGNMDVTGTATVGTVLQDAIAAASSGGNLSLDGNGAGEVRIGFTSTGKIALGDASLTGGITAGAAVTVSDTFDVLIGEGKLTIDQDATDEDSLVITHAATDDASAHALQIVAATTTGDTVSITADDLTSGAVLYLDATDATLTGYYIQCFDGGADDFAVKRYGEVEIAGLDADMITATLGHLQLSAGDIDMDNGKFELDSATATDLNYMKLTTDTDMVADASYFSL